MITLSLINMFLFILKQKQNMSMLILSPSCAQHERSQKTNKKKQFKDKTKDSAELF